MMKPCGGMGKRVVGGGKDKCKGSVEGECLAIFKEQQEGGYGQNRGDKWESGS